MAQFNFGSAGGSGSGSGGNNPFGAPSSSTPNTSAGLFGSTPATAPGAPSLFGQSSAATTKPALTGVFGGGGATAGGPQPSIFGNNPGSNPGSGASTPSLFGGSTGNAPSGGMFAKSAATTSSSGGSGGLFPTANASNTPFGSSGGFNFGQQKKDESGASTPANNENKQAPAPTGSLFSNSNIPATSSIFGTPSTNNASTSAPTGSTTPAPTKTFSFGASTTPAGPPPTENNQSSKPATSNMFGSTNQQSTGGLFSGSKPADSAQTPAGQSLFPGTGSSNTSGGLFNSKPAGSMFGGLGSSNPTSSSANPTATAAPTPEAPKPTFSFPSSTPAAGTSGSQASSTAPAPAASPFGAPKGTPASSAPSQAPSLFAGLSGGTTTNAPGTTTSAPAATPNLFSGLGKTPATTASDTTSASTSAPAPASSLFGAQPAPASSAQPASGTTTSAGPALAATGTGTTNNQSQSGGAALGASTAGPTPQLSRLKNKTMDEIITRWASDLSKYQKEFQEQAAKVASWDRLLVENGEKIQKLYLETFEAEKQSAEVERQLSNVESQQEELSSWLERYEHDVDEMFSRQVGQGETLQGPDQERERTYKLAEKVTDRLDDMNKNLGQMIDAINDASTTLSKSSKTGDPLAEIVKVLNHHLGQLQWIDQTAEVLQAKVVEAQRLEKSIGSNGLGGPESDAADSFYRSYMGRR